MPARWRVASRWLLLAFCVALLPQLALPTYAQTDATTASAALEGRIADPLMPTKKRSNMLAVGAANVLDTYLSAEKYNGTDVRYISTLTKPTRWSNIHQTFLNEGLFVVANNRADNNDELGGMYRFQYRLHRNWQVASGLELEAGAAAGIQVGFLYNTRNSNNPAQAYASLQLMPSAAATHQVTVLRRKAYVSYEVSVPLVGVMFSPNYGQSPPVAPQAALNAAYWLSGRLPASQHQQPEAAPLQPLAGAWMDPTLLTTPTTERANDRFTNTGNHV